MASANIYSIENPPDFEFFANNKNGKDIRCLNYVFRLKTASLASLSLQAISETEISEPFTIVRLNLKHKENCQPKLDDHFLTKKFFQEVKTEVKDNPLVPIHQ